MIHSKRYTTAICFGLLCATVLIITSKRLHDWGRWEATGYYRRPGTFELSDVVDGEPSPRFNATQAGPGLDDTTNTGGGGTGEVGNQYPLSQVTDYYQPGNDNTPPRPLPLQDPVCAHMPDTSRIMLVMKTGASEAYDKVPTQLLTVLRCLPDFLLFSDMDQHIAGYHIRDSLDTVLPEAKDNNNEFDLYRRQKACEVDQDGCGEWAESSDEGWLLDKYKNVHMAEKAWALRPGYDWYIFIDADTYVLWPNMMQWLKQMNPARKHYLGSMAFVGAFPFGHGGSGYVVSKAAMAEFADAGKNGSIANKYDTAIHEVCCGDFLFAVALKETIDVSVENMWPTINGEKPFTLPYGPTNWCQPIVTMHHLNSEELSSFWAFERRRYSSKNTLLPPLTIKDIYHEFVASKLKVVREDWDNISWDEFYLDEDVSQHVFDWRQLRMKIPEENKNDLEKTAHLSFENCRLVCESKEDCFQYKWGDGSCGLQKSFILGKPAPKSLDPNKRMMSGWRVDHILRWIEAQPDCTSPVWPIPTPVLA